MSIELVDIGVNLDHRSFERDRGEVIDRAGAAGVRTMVLTGTNLKSSQGVLELARNQRTGKVRLYSTAGVHPHNARQCDNPVIAALGRLAQNPEVVAIGECGLDFNRDFSPRPLQERWFEAQIALACDLKLPLFLHERDAHTRFVEIIKPYKAKLTGGVVHCFTGTLEELGAYLGLGLHIGITGWICDERRGQHLMELVRYIPGDRLMLETDAPFLTPRNMQPRPKEGRNEPGYLPFVARAVAKAQGKTVEEVARTTTRTALSFFQIPSPE